MAVGVVACWRHLATIYSLQKMYQSYGKWVKVLAGNFALMARLTKRLEARPREQRSYITISSPVVRKPLLTSWLTNVTAFFCSSHVNSITGTANWFSVLQGIQTGCAAQPTAYSTGIGAPFPGGKPAGV
jgi:hypothetical protein